jgi:dTDP-4-dehydrorhamnose 3,5-epimerase
MQKRETPLPDVWLIELKVFTDDRGFFFETFQAQKFAVLGIPANFVQDNFSGSKQGVLRGLHYQIQHAQGKLVQVTHGEVFDVVVDLRKSSANFGKWMGLSLKEGDNSLLWVPPGFAHGYYVLSEWAEVFYKVTDFYAPEYERTLLWNDPELNIKWPIIKDSILNLSVKDAQGKLLKETDVFD